MKKNKENASKNNPLGRKIGRPLRELIPQSMTKNMRDNTLISFPEPGKQYDYHNFVSFPHPFDIPPEWTNDDEINKELLSAMSDVNKYIDPLHDDIVHNLPLNLIQMVENEATWVRPEDYINNYLIDQEIKRYYPKKKYIQMRNDIKETYGKKWVEESSDLNLIDDLLKDDSQARKKNIYQDFYKILDNKQDILVVRYKFRDETDSEYLKRKQAELEERMKQEALVKSPTKKREPKSAVKSPVKMPSKIAVDEDDKIKIKESFPSNIDVTELISNSKVKSSSFVSWLSSIFQTILDLNIRDAYSNKPIFYNIFPQEGGVPVYNPNGRYAVKLYFMGRTRRIDIDDRIICNKNEEYVLPRTEFIEEIWPALFTKALIKLNMYKARHPHYYKREELIDPSYIYELTGFISEVVNIEKMEPSAAVKVIENILSDDVYVDHRKYLLCLNKKNVDSPYLKETYEEYCKKLKTQQEEEINNDLIKETAKQLLGFRDIGRRSTINVQGDKDLMTNIGKALKKHTTSLKLGQDFSPKNLNNIMNKFIRKTSNNMLKTFKSDRINLQNLLVKQNTNPSFLDETDTSLIGSNVIGNFAYSISDFFDNKSFNMSRLKPLDFSDLKQKLKETQVNYKQLSNEAKKEYLQKRKELKMQQHEEKMKRIEELKKEGKKFNLVKIQNEGIGADKLNFIIPYTEEEIYMAKKCLLNKWTYPPPSFFDSFNQPKRIPSANNIIHIPENESMSVDISKVKASNKIPAQWNKETYIQVLNIDIDSYTIQRDPVNVETGGAWIYFPDFRKLFNQFVILHNPNRIFRGGNCICDSNWYCYKTDTYEPLRDYEVFHLNSSSIEDQLAQCALFIIFTPNTGRNIPSKEQIFPYITFDIFDNEGYAVKENVILSDFYSVYSLNDLQANLDYFLILKGGVYPYGYNFQVLTSDHQIENMTHNEYLTRVQSYIKQSFKQEHPHLEKNKLYVLLRLVVTNAEDFKIKFSCKFQFIYIKPYLEIYCHYEGQVKKISFDELINFEDRNSISVDSNKTYTFVITIKPPHHLKENSFELEVLHNSTTLKLENVDNIDPFEVFDNYLPNRYGIVFREYIYPSELVHASLEIDLIRATKNMLPPRKDNSSKGQNLFEYILVNRKEIDEKIRMRVELYNLRPSPDATCLPFSLNKGVLMQSWDFFNTLTIPHLKLEGYPSVSQEFKRGTRTNIININQAIEGITDPPYLMICFLDLEEAPSFLIDDEAQDLFWSIRVYASDTLGFVRDTSKDDYEKALKESWEISEPGRAERAKKSRVKFLLSERKLRGEVLSKEEERLLNEERKIKKSNEALSPTKDKPEKQNEKVSNRSKNSSPIKKTIQVKTVVPVIQSNIREVKTKPLPKPTEHVSYFVKNYLFYTYKDRKLIYDHKLDQYKKLIIDDKVKKEKCSRIETANEEYEKIKQTDLNESFGYRKDFPETLKSFYKTSTTFRSAFKEDQGAVFKAREMIGNEIKTKLEIEKNINDLLSNQGNFDMNYACTLYKEGINLISKGFPPLNNLFTLISNKKEEQIKGELKKLTVKDKGVVTRHLEDISVNKWSISNEVLNKLKEMV